MAPLGDDDLPDVSFQDKLWLWLEVAAAARPDLLERARQAADPVSDRWGYLIELGELLLAENL